MSVGKIIINYFRKHKLTFLLTLFIIILVSIITLAPAFIIKVIGDEYLSKGILDGLFLIAILYVLASIVSAIVNLLKQIILIKISQDISVDIKKKMLLHLHKIDYSTLSKLGTGEIESHFNGDVQSIDTLITSGLVSIMIDTFKIIGIVISIFVLNIYFGFILVIVIPFVLLITALIRKAMFKSQLKNRKMEACVNSDVYEVINNIRTIKTYQAEEYIYEKYESVINSHYRTIRKVNFYDSIFGPIMQVIKYALITVIILLSAYNEQLFLVSIGTILSLVDLITSLFSPLEALGLELQSIQKSMAGIRRINLFLALKEEDKKPLYIADKVGIEFSNVTFSYDNVKVIHELSFKLKEKDRLTILGESGTGKSTIVKLLTGLIKPNSGEVLVDGMNPFLMTNEQRRAYFSILFQDSFFTSGTYREELSLYDKTVTDDKIYEAIKLVGLEKRIPNINELLNFDDFSTGEQVLLNLCRVLIADTKIILLDELNAKLDPLTANKIVSVLDSFGDEKIIVSISHFGKNLRNSKTLSL